MLIFFKKKNKTIKNKPIKFNIFLIGLLFSFSPLNFPRIIKATTINNQKNYVIQDKQPKVEYILGPGDIVNIKVPDLNSSEEYIIDINGYLKISRLGSIFSKDITIKQLEELLTSKYKKFLRFPEVEISLIKPKPIKVFIKGEIKNPGLYTFKNKDQEKKGVNDILNFTLFDLIKEAGGITFYSDLENLIITRNFVVSPHNIEKRKAQINFLSFLLEGDFEKNISLLNGDFIEIRKSKESIKEKFETAYAFNLNPESIDVYITGAVKKPGLLRLKNGTSLNEGIKVAQDFKPFKGKIEFIRLNSDGSIDKRQIKFKSTNKRGSENNPILLSGDLINVNQSLVSNTFETVGSITSPFLGIYSLLNLFQ